MVSAAAAFHRHNRATPDRNPTFTISLETAFGRFQTGRSHAESIPNALRCTALSQYGHSVFLNEEAVLCSLLDNDFVAVELAAFGAATADVTQRGALDKVQHGVVACSSVAARKVAGAGAGARFEGGAVCDQNSFTAVLQSTTSASELKN